MNKKKLALLDFLRQNRKERKQNLSRKFWLHSLVAVRYVECAFYILYAKLRNDDTKFYNYFRMSESTFDYLLE